MRPNWPTTAPKLIQNLRLRVSDCHSAGAGMASHEMATEDCPEPGFSSSHSSYSFMSSGPLPAYHELPRDWISQDCSLPAHPLYTNKKRHSLLKGLTARGSTLALHSKNPLARGSKWRGPRLKAGSQAPEAMLSTARSSTIWETPPNQRAVVKHCIPSPRGVGLGRSATCSPGHLGQPEPRIWPGHQAVAQPQAPLPTCISGSSPLPPPLGLWIGPWFIHSTVCSYSFVHSSSLQISNNDLLFPRPCWRLWGYRLSEQLLSVLSLTSHFLKQNPQKPHASSVCHHT